MLMVGVGFGIFLAWVWKLSWIKDDEDGLIQMNNLCPAVGNYLNEFGSMIPDNTRKECEEKIGSVMYYCDLVPTHTNWICPLRDGSSEAKLEALWSYIRCKDEYTQEYIDPQIVEDYRNDSMD